MHLHRIGDAELGFAAADHRDDHLVARGGLHQHVHVGFVLQHLGDRGCGRVIERRGLQRGEAVGLRRRRLLRGQHQEDKRKPGGQCPPRRRLDVLEPNLSLLSSHPSWLCRPALLRGCVPCQYLHVAAANARLNTSQDRVGSGSAEVPTLVVQF